MNFQVINLILNASVPRITSVMYITPHTYQTSTHVQPGQTRMQHTHTHMRVQDRGTLVAAGKSVADRRPAAMWSRTHRSASARLTSGPGCLRRWSDRSDPRWTSPRATRTATACSTPASIRTKVRFARVLDRADSGTRRVPVKSVASAF